MYESAKSIVIIGSGPAGIATALSLTKIAPDLAADTVVLEKESHPRPKLCGGGITEYAELLLDFLEVDVKARSFPIHKVRFYFKNEPVDFVRENVMRIVRREEFDAELAHHARMRHIELRENEKVVDIRRENGHMRIETEKGSYYAKVVVGADGANGIVRQKCVAEPSSRVSRLMEVLVRVDSEETPEFREHMAVLDFRNMAKRLQGYKWDFPSLIGDEAFLNVGIFDSQVYPGNHADLRKLLLRGLQDRGFPAEEVRLQGHPERWFSPAGKYAAPNVLLVGDAAGIEPLLGEGISMALAYGPIAASTIKAAFAEGDYQFEKYAESISRDRLGKILNRNRKLAKILYARPPESIIALFAKFSKMIFDLRTGKSLEWL